MNNIKNESNIHIICYDPDFANEYISANYPNDEVTIHFFSEECYPLYAALKLIMEGNKIKLIVGCDLHPLELKMLKFVVEFNGGELIELDEVF